MSRLLRASNSWSNSASQAPVDLVCAGGFVVAGVRSRERYVCRVDDRLALSGEELRRLHHSSMRETPPPESRRPRVRREP